MTEHTIIFLTAVLIFLACLVAAYTVYLRRARSISRGDGIDLLLGRLIIVDRGKLAQVATDRTVADGDEADLDSWQVWELTGGLAGIEALAANCEVLIGLACHVQEWYPEALPITEQLRMNAREIQWHLERVRAAQQHGHGKSAYPEYAQRAVAIYFDMTQHVLSLYEAAGMTTLTQLQAVL